MFAVGVVNSIVTLVEVEAVPASVAAIRVGAARNNQLQQR